MNTERGQEDKRHDHGRGKMLRRQWEIYALLESHRQGLSARQISQKVGAPYRTILRDLDVMLTVMPIYYDVEMTGGNNRGRTYMWKRLRKS